MERDIGNNSRLIKLRVPGLAEKRPSVLRGDVVNASLSDQSTNRVVFRGIT